MDNVFDLSLEQRRAFQLALSEASRRDQVHLAIRNLYMALEDAIDLRRPTCISSGRCCRFDEFGHQLFVTTMEMATFLADLKQFQARPVEAGLSGCPYQLDRLCSVHQVRPFGCRVFFCDETSTGWQHETYARFHAELKRLHNQLEVPYFYLEWRRALQLAAPLAGRAPNQ